MAVEVLSQGNTRKEMERKLKEYFLAGTRLVWVIDAKNRQARVHTVPDVSIALGESDVLGGGDVLPGFTLALRPLFDTLAEPAKKSAKPKGNGKKAK